MRSYPHPPLKWTLPALSQSFITSSLPCFNFVGYKMCSNSEIDKIFFVHKKWVMVGQFVFVRAKHNST